MEQTQKNTDTVLSKLIVLVVIVLIGFAIYKSPTMPQKIKDSGTQQDTNVQAFDILTIRGTDYIAGTKDAPITVIEYSDLECPYCRLFHATMVQALSKYTGKIAWIYRNYPLEGLHKQARTEANAVECIGGLAGNNAFWNAVNTIFATTKSNDGLDLSTLPSIAKSSGVSEKDFASCMSAKTYDSKITSQTNEVQMLGAQGTPFSIIINNAKGESTPVYGYENIDALSKTIDGILSK